MNRLFTTVALHAAIVFFAAGVAGAATSTFDAGTEDWSALGDVAGPVQWSATDGNPGGYITVEDSVTGGVTYFSAPPAFLGDQTAFLGRALVFDVRQHITGAPNQFQDDDVVLIGGGLTLVHDFLDNPPIGIWTTYTVPLEPSSWKLGASVPSAAEFEQVLSALTALHIRAEYQTGADVGDLDNAAFVPEPSLASMGLVSSAILLGLRGLRGRPSR
jgi:hypothetical protein